MLLLPLIFTLTSILTLASSQSTGRYKKIVFILFIIYIFETRSCYVARAGLEPTVPPTNFSLLSDGMTGMSHHTWLKYADLKIRVFS